MLDGVYTWALETPLRPAASNPKDAANFKHAAGQPDMTSSHPALEAQLQATLNVIPAYAWYAVPSGALTFVNERCADYLGLPKDHPLRFGIDLGAEWDSHLHFVHPDDHEENRNVWLTCLRLGCGDETTFRVRNAKGRYRWFLSRVEPLRASDGTLLYWIGVNLDIEDRKQAELYLAEGQRLAHMGSWAFSAAGFEYWSRELFQIHGLDPSGKPPTVEEYGSAQESEKLVDLADSCAAAVLAHSMGMTDNEWTKILGWPGYRVGVLLIRAKSSLKLLRLLSSHP